VGGDCYRGILRGGGLGGGRSFTKKIKVTDIPGGEKEKKRFGIPNEKSLAWKFKWINWGRVAEGGWVKGGGGRPLGKKERKRTRKCGQHKLKARKKTASNLN